jgi:hypothetical protein
MNTINMIVRELEQIPKPMQLSVLDFIRSLGNTNIAATQSETGVKVNNPSGICFIILFPSNILCFGPMLDLSRPFKFRYETI